MNSVYDLVIVGGGPIGINIGIEAQRAGLNYLILEKGVLVNSIFNFPTNMTFFSTSKLLEIGEVPFISHSDKPTRREALEYFRRVVQSWQLNAHFYEGVESVDKNADGLFRIVTKKGVYLSRKVALATGFYGDYRPLDVPGEELPKVRHYYDEPHCYVGQKIIIVGAANSACDVALETYHKGAEVTMVVRKPEINPKVKYWIRPNIINRIKEGVIQAHFNSEVIHIREREVDIRTPDGVITLENDFVLAMTGYRPNFDFLASCGLQFSDDGLQIPQHDPETLESNVEGLYLAGVINAGMQTSKLFIENTRVHAGMIIDHIKSQLSVGTAS